MYKCLGLSFDEFVTLDYACKPWLGWAGKGTIIVAKFKITKDIGYKMDTKLNDCRVSPILDCTCEF